MKEFTENDKSFLKEGVLGLCRSEARHPKKFIPTEYERRFFSAKIGKPKTSRVTSWCVSVVFDRLIKKNGQTISQVKLDKLLPIFRTKTEAQEWADGLTSVLKDFITKAERK